MRLSRLANYLITLNKVPHLLDMTGFLTESVEEVLVSWGR